MKSSRKTMHSSSSVTASSVGLSLGPKCSEAVVLSTLTTKMFVLSLLCCSPPSSCSEGGRDSLPSPPRLRTYQHHPFPVLCSALTSKLLPVNLVSAEHKQQRNGAVHCVYRLLFSPAQAAGCLWPDCFPALFASPLSCVWIGEKMSQNLSFLRLVADPLSLPANGIVSRELVPSYNTLPLPVAASCFFEGKKWNTDRKKHVFHIKKKNQA